MDNTLTQSDTSIITRCNTLATAAAALSIAMYLDNVQQIGSLTAIAPGIALCCGLFGVVVSAWKMIRNFQLVYVVLTVWGVLPVAWTIYFLLVVHPASLRVE